MEEFARLAVDPLLGAGREALTESDWIALQQLLLPYASWMAEKPAVPVATLGAERVLVLASGESAKSVSDLIAQDLRLEAECSRMEAVEKAIRLRRDRKSVV